MANPVPCCLCKDTGMPGKVDPKTKECLCKCFCDPPDNKIPSVKPKDGECKCKNCPDGSLKKWAAKIKCPCTCADGKETEMEEDGSCDCGCMCEDGVTKDKTAADGSCPCRCTCKNCVESTIGPDGCKCPEDTCPRCKSGEQATWQGCECKCSQPCGHPPTCASGRRGSTCDQPDCGSCQGCSGHGVCTKAPGCSAFCRCSRRWEGDCCERRVPRRTWGDPHIETLDGIEFDYFGIGQFWDCKSEENDFGCQVRYFHYKQTSLTGAVALKAGQSVVTITTPAVAQPGDAPTVRIDGVVQDASRSLKKALSNDAVLLDILPRQSSSDGADATSGTMISLQFQKGTSVTVATSYSAKMKRLFLNVGFTATAEFFEKTAGLCGYMDDDDTNDLTGPDGTLYNSTDEFAESWRILIPQRPGAGALGSWSWTESNFHPDDVMDSSYTDPSYKPVYTLEGYSPNMVNTATALCEKQGVTGTLLKGCIYDVVVSNDTALAEQETLKIGCPNKCSGKGRCVNDTCECLAGWSTDDCHVGSCGSCYHGDCEAGFCQCHIGWDGADCSKKATCGMVNDCTDAAHGVCRSQDVCLCQDGFTGADCSVTATCYNQQNCSAHGVCVGIDVCRCDLGWTSSSCSQPSCEILNWCSGHGRCIAHDVCLCESGWTDNSCSIPDCSNQNDCSNHGDCLHPGTCSCHPGYEGADCSGNTKCTALDNCNGHGLCLAESELKDNKKQSVIKCRCDPGFGGITCNSSVCEPSCSSHGRCVEPDLCSCNVGYMGSTCEQFSCETKNKCSGHGQCTGLEQCTCDDGWSSNSCGTANCTSLDDCSSQGQCISPDTCYCYDGFEGRNCSQPVSDNLNTPVFNQSDYYCAVSEKAKSGLSLVDVFATDVDEGKNGDIRYVLEPYGAEIDATSYLVVDSVSGRVSLLSPISRNLLTSDTLLVWVKAVDGGLPPKEAKAQLHIRIIDVNDHCPEFHSPDSGSIYFVNMSTEVNTTVVVIDVTDDDFGDNGNVTISFAARSENVVRDTFNIDSTSGRISSLVSPLTVGTFPVVIVATDGATNPCSRQLSITIQVLPPDVEPLTTTTPTTTTMTDAPTTSTTTTGASPRSSAITSSTQSQEKTTSNLTPLPTSRAPSTSTTMQPATTKGGQTSRETTTTTTTGKLTSHPVSSTPAAETTPQRTDDSPTNESSKTGVVVMGSMFAIVLMVAVLIIVGLRFQVANVKAQLEEKPAGIQTRWHTRFTDRFQAHRE